MERNQQEPMEVEQSTIPDANQNQSKENNSSNIHKRPRSLNLSFLLHNREIDGAVVKSSLGRNSLADTHYSSNSAFRNHISFVSRLKIEGELKKHEGCVNSVQWNTDGTKLITGSDDCDLKIWSGSPDYSELFTVNTGHFRNIFSAQFVPHTNDTQMLSTGMDGEVRYHVCDSSGRCSSPVILGNYDHMVYKIFFLPSDEKNVFVTTHQDGCVRLFDLREHNRNGSRSSGEKQTLVKLRNTGRRRNFSANSLAFCLLGTMKFVVGGADPYIRLFDLRMLQDTTLKLEETEKRVIHRFCPSNVLDSFRNSRDSSRFYITGLDYNREQEVVATYSGENVYMFNVNAPTHQKSFYNNNNNNNNVNGLGVDGDVEENVVTQYEQVYRGRRNVATFLKEVAFLGDHFSSSSRSSFVATGSDCGHLFIWDKKSGELVQLLKGDHSIVNGIAPHPHLPILAMCGIDSYAKVLEPTAEDPTFNKEKAKAIVDRNTGQRTGLSHDYDDEEEEELSDDDFNLFQIILQALRRRQDSQMQRLNEEEEAERQRSQEQIARENSILKLSEELRTSANELFKSNHFVEAIAQYDEALKLLDFESNSQVINNSRIQARIHCLNNKAACYLKIGENERAVRLCDEVLEEEENNYKALYRRAQAFIKMKQFERAYQDIQEALKSNPDDKPLQIMLKELRSLWDNGNNNA